MSHRSIDIEELKKNLKWFTGTEQWYKVYPNILITDGVKYLADTAECYWLIDTVHSCQLDKAVKKATFQVYELTVDLETGKADLVVTDGNENVLFKQHLPLTTFPLPSIKLYYTDGVLLLPSEY